MSRIAASDEDLLVMPSPPLTANVLFVCTYEGLISNIKIPNDKLTAFLEPTGHILAFNSNFGHKAQPGFEQYLKFPDPVKKEGKKPRKLQGDGTCFNSTVEPVIGFNCQGRKSDKVYYVKCFPTTGQTQVPGVLKPDLSDGYTVLQTWVDYLNEQGVGTKDETGKPRKIEIVSSKPNMLNFKCQVRCCTPRLLVHLALFAEYMDIMERFAYYEKGKKNETVVKDRLHAGSCLVVPPYRVKEVTIKGSLEVKFSCRFEVTKDRRPRVNIFQSGKVNILGADSFESAGNIYHFLMDMFTLNWGTLMRLKPLPDNISRKAAEKKAAAPPKPKPSPTPAVRFSDADMADLMGELGLGSVSSPMSRVSTDSMPQSECSRPTSVSTNASTVSWAAEEAKAVKMQKMIELALEFEDWGFDDDEGSDESSEDSVVHKANAQDIEYDEERPHEDDSV